MITKHISNIEAIKNDLKTVVLPATFKLSEAEIITDVPKFLASSIFILETDKLTTFYKPYYVRFKKLLDVLKIKIIITEQKED